MRYNDFDEYFERKTEYVYPTTYNKDVALHTQPHYTDQRFDKEQTVFGKPAKSAHGHSNLEYVYSDRIWQWDYAKAEEAANIANESGFVRASCHWYEAYLSYYFDRQVEIKHIVAGVNVSNGYPYAVFGYIYLD